VQVVDVRSANEHASGHIPGAVNIPMDQIESRLDDLNQRGSVVLVCHSGNRASMTCELLQGKHPELGVLAGGTQAWIDAGLPTVKSSKVRWSIERQVRLTVGVLVLLGLSLALAVNIYWLILPAFLGAGLTFAGLTDFCGMAYVYGKMPWNRPPAGSAVTSC
jgi:rhodanese-related sulfurtransferase